MMFWGLCLLIYYINTQVAHARGVAAADTKADMARTVKTRTVVRADMFRRERGWWLKRLWDR
ncbi:hypothetical protein CLU79DRAFT_759733 [Phycomyces nitens]|nr:hypothetical protein CLU79DRAFT_759733 [Phycomyces nitens]